MRISIGQKGCLSFMHTIWLFLRKKKGASEVKCNSSEEQNISGGSNISFCLSRLYSSADLDYGNCFQNIVDFSEDLKGGLMAVSPHGEIIF